MRYLHTMLRVRDLDRALDFYCNKLGLKEMRRREYYEKPSETRRRARLRAARRGRAQMLEGL